MSLKCAKNVFLFLFILTRIFDGIVADMEIHDFINFIIEVRKFYGSSNVIISYDEHSLDFSFHRTLTEIIKLFSREDMQAQAVKYGDIKRCRNFPSVAAPLIVLSIHEKENLEHFLRIRKKHSMSSIPWLLLIDEEAMSHRDCVSPKGNPFNLRINSKVLVKCGGSNEIKLYYSVKDNVTNVIDFGTWTTDGKLKLNQSEEFLKVRKDMTGVTLKVAESIRKNATTTGGKEGKYLNNLLDLLENISGFTPDIVSESYGRFCNETYKGYNCSSVVRTLAEGRADLVFAFSSMSGERSEVVDFPIVLMESQFHLYMQFSNSTKIQWSAYFKAFNLSAWIALGLILLILSAAFMLVRIEAQQFNVSFSSFFESFINVWGIYTQQGLAETSSTFSKRILCFTILMSSLFLYTIYSAAFTSYITKLRTDLPFPSYDAFLNQSYDYKVAVLRHSSAHFFIRSNDTKQHKMWPMLEDYNRLPDDPYGGFEQACKGKIVFYIDSVTYDSMNQQIPCTLGGIKTEDTEYLTIPLQKNSPYTTTFNYYFLRLIEHGLLTQLKNKYFTKYQEITVPEPNIISLIEVVPVFAILVYGVFASLMVLGLEFMAYCCQRACSRKRRVSKRIELKNTRNQRHLAIKMRKYQIIIR